MSTTQSERLRELLEPLVSSQGLDLEEIEVDSVGRKRVLRVVVDSDEGADLDAIADVSRALSAKLDETDAMGQGEYTLEVGTPGAERERRGNAPPVGDRSRQQHRAVEPLLDLPQQGERRQGAGVPACPGTHQDEPVDAIFGGFARMLDVDHVVKHHAAIGMSGITHFRHLV